MEEARADGDEDDEGGNSEDEDVAGSAGDRTASQFLLHNRSSEEDAGQGGWYPVWWKQHVQEFHRVTRMVRQHLAVPATSASPERLFSSVGLVKSDFRGFFDFFFQKKSKK
jgi:hypothetical protein